MAFIESTPGERICYFTDDAQLSKFVPRRPLVARTHLLSDRVEDRFDGLGVEDWHCAASAAAAAAAAS